MAPPRSELDRQRFWGRELFAPSLFGLWKKATFPYSRGGISSTEWGFIRLGLSDDRRIAEIAKLRASYLTWINEDLSLGEARVAETFRHHQFGPPRHLRLADLRTLIDAPSEVLCERVWGDGRSFEEIEVAPPEDAVALDPELTIPKVVSCREQWWLDHHGRR